MLNFEFHNPTKIFFGKGQISKLSEVTPKNAKIMLAYGGGSIKQNGVYDQVYQALQGYDIIEFAGIEPNPTYETLMQAVELARRENITFILAVGGGSVIDGVKFISVAIPFAGEPWDILEKGLGKSLTQAIPFGSVLTIPATGSEMNSGSVVSRKATKQKLAFGSPLCFPMFSVLDPEVMRTLPARQIANGIVDAYTHVMEQYLTYPVGAALQDRIAEGILLTLIEQGPKVYQNPNDYEAAANLMWSATMALNGLLRLGVPTDWATHMIGHELTALFGIDHARTLAIVSPSLYRVMKENKKEKLLQYGERVWGIKEGTEEERIEKAIAQTVAFYHSLDIDTRLSAYTSDYQRTANEIVDRFISRGWKQLGEKRDVTPDKVKEIVEMSY
ncbi:MAG: iron-containing alcohol dehydrogenase [Cytophagales bacterium]|nr:MAG: iron-containing alcohol dehydrogenase [Cytophagales bacterium]